MTLRAIIELMEKRHRITLVVDKQELTGSVESMSALLNDIALEATVQSIDIDLAGKLVITVSKEAPHE